MKAVIVVLLVACLIASSLAIAKANELLLSSSSSSSSTSFSTLSFESQQTTEKYKRLISKVSQHLNTAATSEENTHDALLQKLLGYHHEELQRHHNNKKQQTQGIETNTHNQPFLIELNSDNACQGASDCHSEMMSRLGVDKQSYEIISKDIALVTTSWDKLDTHLTATSADSTEGATSISSYVAFHPSLKLSKAVVEMKQYQEGKEACFKSDNPSVSSVGTAFKLLVVLSPPQSEEAYEQFLSFLDSMMSDEKYNDEIIEEIITDLDERAGYHGSQRFASTDDATSSNNNTKRRLSSKTRSRALQIDNERSTKKVLLQVLIKDCSKVYEIAEQFSLRPEVLSIDRLPDIYMLNKFAKRTCDSGDASNPLQIVGSHLDASMSESSMVGIVDTGLDLEQCYFYDQTTSSSSPFVYTDSLSNIKYNLNHRKVQTYIAFADRDENDEKGHGTSVSGTLAGKFASFSGIHSTAKAFYEPFNGMNPNTKINFYDIQRTSAVTGTNQIVFPTSINENMFLVLKKAGSSIISNSWGSDTYAYDSYCYQSDAFMYENPDTLLVVAAGNNGENGAGTIVTPASAKNVLAVGASVSDQASWSYAQDEAAMNDPTHYNKHTVAAFTAQGPTVDGRLKPDILAPGEAIFTAIGHKGTTAPYCSLDVIAGTSIATPVITGMVNYIRQYFLDGYYNPLDNQWISSKSDHGFVPSGALLKAMIIHSGQAMRYRQSSSSASGFSALKVYPSIEQGYGRAQIASVLKFSEVDNDDSGYMPASGPNNLFVIGSAWYQEKFIEKGLYQSIAMGSSHTYWLKVPDDAMIPDGETRLSFRVTLAYTDAPVAMFVNNVMSSRLMLSITESSDTCDRETSGSIGGIFACTSFPTLGKGVTMLSNVQMIDMLSVTRGRIYQIKIHNALESLTQSQPYALVITGAFEMLSMIPDVKTAAASPSSASLSIEKATKFIYQGIGTEEEALGQAFTFSVPIVKKPTMKPTLKPSRSPTRFPSASVPTLSPSTVKTNTVKPTTKPTNADGSSGGGGTDDVTTDDGNSNPDSNGKSNGSNYERTTSFALMIAFVIVFVIVVLIVYIYYVLVYSKKEAADAEAREAKSGKHRWWIEDGIEFEEVTLDRGM